MKVGDVLRFPHAIGPKFWHIIFQTKDGKFLVEQEHTGATLLLRHHEISEAAETTYDFLDPRANR